MAEKYRDTGFINRGGSGMEIIRAIEEDYNLNSALITMTSE